MSCCSICVIWPVCMYQASPLALQEKPKAWPPPTHRPCRCACDRESFNSKRAKSGHANICGTEPHKAAQHTGGGDLPVVDLLEDPRVHHRGAAAPVPVIPPMLKIGQKIGQSMHKHVVNPLLQHALKAAKLEKSRAKGKGKARSKAKAKCSAEGAGAGTNSSDEDATLLCHKTMKKKKKKKRTRKAFDRTEALQEIPPEAAAKKLRVGQKNYTVKSPGGKVMVLLEKRAYYVKPVEKSQAAAHCLLGTQTNSFTLPLNKALQGVLARQQYRHSVWW